MTEHSDSEEEDIIRYIGDNEFTLYELINLNRCYKIKIVVNEHNYAGNNDIWYYINISFECINEEFRELGNPLFRTEYYSKYGLDQDETIQFILKKNSLVDELLRYLLSSRNELGLNSQVFDSVNSYRYKLIKIVAILSDNILL